VSETVPDILPELQGLFYKKELQSFLNSFVEPVQGIQSGQFPPNVPISAEQVLKDIQEIMKADGLLHPAELRAQLTKKYMGNENPALWALFTEMDHGRFIPDTMTGYMQKPHLGLSSALGHLFARLNTQHVAMIEVDYSNMGGTNDFHQIKLLEEHADPLAADLINLIKSKAETPQAFEALFRRTDPKSQQMISLFRETQSEAFKLTDKTAKLIALSIERDVQEILPDGAKILPVRAGGDELRLIVSGIDPKNYTAVELRINQSIELHMAKLGLHDHPHLKAPNDPLKRGFGASVALVNMKSIDPAHVVEEADLAIKANKLVLGHDRNGTIDYTTLRLAFTQIFNQTPFMKPEGPDQDIQEAIAHALEGALKASQRRKAYFDRYKPQASFSIADRNSYMEQNISEIESMKLSVFKSEVPEFLKNPTATLPLFSTPAARRAVALEEELQRRAIDIQDMFERNLVRDYAYRMTPLDPAAGVWMPNDLPETLDYFVQDTKEIEHKLRVGHLTPYTVSTSFHNLGGLNDALGHDGANAVLLEMTQNIIRNAMQFNGVRSSDYQIAHYGGAEFHMILKPIIKTAEGVTTPLASETVLQIERDIAENTRLFSSTQIIEFMDRKGIILSPQARSALEGLTFEDIKDIKKERNISGIDVITHSSPVELNGKSAGFYLQKQRDALSEKVSQFREKKMALSLEEKSPTHIQDHFSSASQTSPPITLPQNGLGAGFSRSALGDESPVQDIQETSHPSGISGERKLGK
jgi:GGDEF domain-containing protein